MRDKCFSKVKMEDESFFCELSPHNAKQDHVATVAMLLQPNAWNGMATQKWIHGKITWNDRGK